MHVELLPASAADDEGLTHALAGLINRAYAAGEEGLWLEGTRRITSVQVADAVRAGGMLAATLDGRIVGCAYVRPIDATRADLGLVAADPEQWGSGVGRRIVGAAEDLMRSRGVRTAQLELLVPRGWTHPAKDRLRSWYSRLGYRMVRTAPFEAISTQAAQLATPCEFLVFEKPLAGQVYDG